MCRTMYTSVLMVCRMTYINGICDVSHDLYPGIDNLLHDLFSPLLLLL